MGFSGRPSKGCAPCRAKRTKCDLVQPFCTQCVRKGKVCFGYRNEQDLLFRNETSLVLRKAKRRNDESGSASSSSTSSADSLAVLLSVRSPSRRAAVGDEAIYHFFAHYNEKFFAASGQENQGGFDYILPVFKQDIISGGPLPEIIKANGLAALGNVKGAPELLTAARAAQSKVLGRLNQQLQDPKKALSDSSILTCILLAVFENIICDSPHAAQALTYHLKGAATLAELRGVAQFTSDVGSGIYARMRGFMLAHCLQTRDPLPSFILHFLQDDEISQRDFEPAFYKLLARLCQLRAQHKEKGYVEESMADEARTLMDEFEAWQPNIAEWKAEERPSLPTDSSMAQSNEAYRYVWLATTWIFQRTARILASDLVIEWARADVLASPSSLAAATLDDTLRAQIELCEELKESTIYYLKTFRDTESAMRTVGGYGLLWPLYVLSTASTSTVETMQWIAVHSEQIANEFGVRQGKMMADFMKMYI
ncbi:hypothetical protein CC78DRAFT_536295 [Lojkania enalia]|uniref:Zn(2)-C6 fungal-type domain-containing protein n=1 Tax=Lojkania enalia TaxID=147567 RepID=A0A9P4MZT6_9PLEO|nr:hypothetical protein CC78DRAFT_536295 [Didymosphaeria enalia]